MKRFPIILLALVLAFGLAGPVQAEGKQWPTSVSKYVSVAGDAVVAFTAKSGLKVVVDAGLLVDEDDADSGLYVYYQAASLVAANTDAVAQTAVLFTNTAASSIARTGDIMYSITRADDPSDSVLVYHGQISSITFSDAGNTTYCGRAASQSEATLTAGDTVYFGAPLTSVRGAAAVSVLPYTVTDDAAIVFFSENNVAAAYTASGMNMLVAESVFPVGKFGKDYLVRWDTGAANVDGEVKNLTVHYEKKK